MSDQKQRSGSPDAIDCSAADGSQLPDESSRSADEIFQLAIDAAEEKWRHANNQCDNTRIKLDNRLKAHDERKFWAITIWRLKNVLSQLEKEI